MSGGMGSGDKASSGPTSKEQRRRDLINGLFYCACSLLFGVQANLVGPAASILARQVDGSESELGPVIGMGGLMCILGGVPSGWIVDAFPGHAVLGISMAVQAVGFFLLPYCRSVSTLTLVYAVIALTYNNINTGLNSLTAWVFTGPASAFWLNTVSTMFGVGGLLAPMVVWLSQARFDSDSGCFFVTAAVTAVCAVVGLLLTSPQNPALLPFEHSASAAQPLLLPLGGGDDRAAGAAAGGPMLRPLAGPDKWRRASGLLVPVFGIIFVNIAIELTFGAWIFTYAVRQANFLESSAQMTTSLYWFAFTIGRALAAISASAVSPATILLCSTPFAIAGSLLPLVPALQTYCPWTLYLTVCLIGVGASTGYANTLSLTAEYLALDGFLNGIFGTIAGVAWTVFPWVVPFLATHSAWHYQWLMVLVLVMAVLQMVLIFWMIRAGAALRRRQVAWQAAEGGGRQRGRGGEGAGRDSLEEPLLAPYNA